MLTIEQWLDTHGLGQYAEVFAENDIDIRVLPELTEDDLKELGVSLGHRRLLQKALAVRSDADTDARVVPETPQQVSAPVVPSHLAKRIMESRHALTGERKHVTVLFADIKGSMALIAGTDPEYASRIIDPAVEAMMSAVHQFDGTVNRVLGDGIMSLFGAPIAHEDHAVRACYAALAMRTALARISQDTRAAVGIDLESRIGLNSGEVIVRAIGNDLTMNYDAIGETTHLAARMEQTARNGGIRMARPCYLLARDFITADPLGAIPIKGMPEPVEVFELTGASAIRTRIQASAASGFTSFVGRQDELSLIERRQQSVAQGRGQVVGVVGEAGAGKSRLYFEYIRSDRTANWRVLECGTVSHGKASAYVPITDLLRGYFGIAEDDSPRTIHERVLGRLLTLDEGLRDTLPALLFVLGVPVEDTAWQASDAASRRGRIREAVCALVLREATVNPLILVLEDLHWFDRESLGVVGALIEHIGGTQVLMLLNFRPDFHDLWSARSYFTRVQLEPLDSAVVEDMLGNLLGHAGGLDTVKRLLIERADGNPFFIEESVRTLVEEGVLVGKRGGYDLTRPDVTIEIPASVHAVLAARIDRLEPDDKHVLQSAAVVGKNFSLALLRDIETVDTDTLDSALATLQSTEFIYETRLFPDKEYTFRHALTHEVAYASVIGHQRVERHAAIVSAYKAMPGELNSEDVNRLAFHAAQGECWDDAFHFGRDSGRILEEQSAPREATDAYLQALVAFEHLEANDERLRIAIDIHSRIRDVLFVLGEQDKISAHLQAAAELVKRTGDREQLAWLHLQQSGSLWATGKFDAAVVEAGEAKSVANEIGDPALLALACYRHGIALVGLGCFTDAVEVLQQALIWLSTDEGRKYFQLGGFPYSFACAFLAWSLAELGETERALDVARDGWANAEHEQHAYSRTVTAFGLCHALALAGLTGEAIRVVERVLVASDDVDINAASPWGKARLAYAFAVEQHVEQANALIDQVAESMLNSRSPEHASVGVWVARALLVLDQLDRAETWLDQQQALAEAQNERSVAAWFAWMRADIALRRGANDATVQPLLQTARSLAEEMQLGPLKTLCNQTSAQLATVH